MRVAQRRRGKDRKSEGGDGDQKGAGENPMQQALAIAHESGAKIEQGGAAAPAEAAAPKQPSGDGANTGSVANFKSEKVLSSTPAKVELDHAGGANYSATEDTRKVDSLSRTDSLSIVFKDVDRATFEKLRTAYSGWSKTPSQANFDKLSGGKEIIAQVPISTFLPPLMQALLDKAFNIQHFSDGTDATTNCWSTAYEVERQAETGADDYTLFFSAGAVKNLVMDNKWSKVVAQPSGAAFAKMTPAERGKIMQAGDSICFFAGSPSANGLMHEAVVLDNDLCFQKPNYGGGDPFQLTTITALLESGGMAGAAVQIRRWNSANPLPEIMEYMKAQNLVSKSPDGGSYFDNGAGHGPDIISGKERPEAFEIKTMPNGIATLVPAPHKSK